MASPSNRRATKRRRSSITELAFHGIHTSRPQRRKVLPMCPVRNVTYVSGRSPVYTASHIRVAQDRAVPPGFESPAPAYPATSIPDQKLDAAAAAMQRVASLKRDYLQQL